MADLSVWILKSDCERDAVLRTSLDFFRDRFVGRPMRAEWTPPTIELSGKRQRLLYSPDDPTRIIDLSEIRFVEAKIPDRPIFKLREYPSHVFVRRPFVDAVIGNGLRGAVFADPVANPFHAILRGQSHNVIPGLPE